MISLTCRISNKKIANHHPSSAKPPQNKMWLIDIEDRLVVIRGGGLEGAGEMDDGVKGH